MSESSSVSFGRPVLGVAALGVSQVLHELLVRRRGSDSVDITMVKSERDGDHVADLDLAVHNHGPLVGGADGDQQRDIRECYPGGVKRQEIRGIGANTFS